jgi:hypothetical protein
MKTDIHKHADIFLGEIIFVFNISKRQFTNHYRNTRVLCPSCEQVGVAVKNLGEGSDSSLGSVTGYSD